MKRQTTMKVVLLVGFLLGANIVSSAVLDTPSASADKPKIFYDAIFNISALAKYGNLLLSTIADKRKELCLLDYEQKNFEILSNKGELLLRCMQVSDKDLKNYFENHKQGYFEGNFTSEILKCTYQSTGRKVMDCYVDKISKSLCEIKGDAIEPPIMKQLCVRLTLERFIRQANEATDKLINCLSQVNHKEKPASPMSNNSIRPLPPTNGNETHFHPTPLPWNNSSQVWQPKPPYHNSTQQQANTSQHWQDFLPWHHLSTRPNSTDPWITYLSPLINSTTSNSAHHQQPQQQQTGWHNLTHPWHAWQNSSTHDNSTMHHGNSSYPLNHHTQWHNSSNSNSSNLWTSLAALHNTNSTTLNSTVNWSTSDTTQATPAGNTTVSSSNDTNGKTSWWDKIWNKVKQIF